MRDHDERAALVALLRYTESGWGWRQTAEEVAEQGSAVEVLRAVAGGQLFDDPTEGLISRAADEIAEWEAAGTSVVSYFDDDYPSQLRDVHDFPPLLFLRGELAEYDAGVCGRVARCVGGRGEVYPGAGHRVGR